ncbi:hypothetical protein JTE90_015812 [Oedothorax gibbosus]|uniref:HNH endonuclease n=1 Tax=Oedothorax gibbosus TaxID=931172 RepID=A0AAV6TCZ3_9ARAC|nr:hypothetical protein JTE90_015812 [Oedothorax gibbosus]
MSPQIRRGDKPAEFKHKISGGKETNRDNLVTAECETGRSQRESHARKAWGNVRLGRERAGDGLCSKSP